MHAGEGEGKKEQRPGTLLTWLQDSYYAHPITVLSVLCERGEPLSVETSSDVHNSEEK